MANELGTNAAALISEDRPTDRPGPPTDDGVYVVDADKRPPGVELVRDIPAPEGKIIVRPLSSSEGFRRIAAQRMREPAIESEAARAARERAEADVVNAARRSQAEIRRHVDSYLKEHFETIAADVAAVVVDQVHDRLVRGIASTQEAQAISLDRIAADMRKQLRAFIRSAWGSAPAAQARRAPGARRAKAKR